MKTSKLFPYPGGKHWFLKVLLLCVPEHNEYLELFAGGASLFFGLPKVPGRVETLNDADEDIANLYTQFVENYRKFQRRVHTLARSAVRAEEFLGSYVDRAVWHSLDPFERAYRHWYLLKTCVSSHLRRSGSTISRKKLVALHSGISLKSQHDRLKDANIDCLDFRVALQRYATPKTVVYADPPYHSPTEDLYACRMTKLDHIALAAHLHACGSKVLVSYDDTLDVRKLYSDWNIISIPWTYRMSPHGLSDGQELLISNYPLDHKAVSKTLKKEVEYVAGGGGNE
jgi:DNA adenine methylase